MNEIIPEPYLTRFLSRIDIKLEDDCWNWIKGKNSKGYGEFKIGKKQYSSHRLSYEIFTKKLSNKIVVRHICDNTSCCNPKHLIEGSQLDNVADMVSRNRQAKGEDINHSKLDKFKVMNIRNNPNNLSNKELANMYKVSLSTIYDVKNFKIWKHL